MSALKFHDYQLDEIPPLTKVSFQHGDTYFFVDGYGNFHRVSITTFNTIHVENDDVCLTLSEPPDTSGAHFILYITQQQNDWLVSLPEEQFNQAWLGKSSSSTDTTDYELTMKENDPAYKALSYCFGLPLTPKPKASVVTDPGGSATAKLQANTAQQVGNMLVFKSTESNITEQSAESIVQAVISAINATQSCYQKILVTCDSANYDASSRVLKKVFEQHQQDLSLAREQMEARCKDTVNKNVSSLPGASSDKMFTPYSIPILVCIILIIYFYL